MRRLASFSRYSMPKTESNLPTLRANSCEAKGITRAKACSASTRVDSPIDEALRNRQGVFPSLDGWVTGNGAETEGKVKDVLSAAGVGYPNLIYAGDQDPLIEGFQLPGPIPYSVLYDPRGQPLQNWAGKAPIREVRAAIAGVSPRPAGAPGGR